MTNDQLRLQYLLRQYAENRCTRNELLELFNTIEKAKDDESLYASLAEVWKTLSMSDPLPVIDKERIFSNVIHMSAARVKTRRKWVGYAAAAVIAFLVAFGIYNRDKMDILKSRPSYTDVKIVGPGSNKAVLTLANGDQIALNDRHRGILASQNHVPVIQLKNGAIAYEPGAAIADQSFNSLSTPRGGQYAVTLADGTKVWLNSLSTLKYPVVFTGKERRVELTGEAYFEVAKNKAAPFIITVNHSEVKVFGTHFNIMGYTEENNTNVTLLEGSVMVSSAGHSKMLIPGQQAQIKDLISISNADGDAAIAWKNGKFNFAHEQIQTIMRKLARWYDIDVSYSGEITKEGFVGTIPRSQNLSEVLKTLELTGLVHFSLQGRSVTVMP